jgi:hemolysin type calcium-binding protein
LLSVTAGLVLALPAGAAVAVNNMSAGNCTRTSKNDRVYGNGGEDWLKGGTDQDVLYGHKDNGQGHGPYGRGHGTRAPGDDFLRGGTADKTNDGTQRRGARRH